MGRNSKVLQSEGIVRLGSVKTGEKGIISQPETSAVGAEMLSAGQEAGVPSRRVGFYYDGSQVSLLSPVIAAVLGQNLLFYNFNSNVTSCLTS